MYKKGLLLSLLLIINVLLIAQTPTKWRGPQGSGVYSETGLLTEWPVDGPEIVWTFDGLGDGHSSPAFANDGIYLTAMEDTTGFVYFLSIDGKLQWKAPYATEFSESYPGARSTPVIAGDHLYVYSGHGDLVCMNAANGAVRWQKNVLKEFGGKNITWGVTETPVVDGDVIYITPGGAKSNVVALNRFDGKLIWSSPGKGEPSAYCTPILVELPARKLLVTMTADHILGIDTADGKLLWSHPQTNRWKVHANTPIYHDGGLFCFSGYGQGGVKLELKSDGSAVTKAWFSEMLDSRIGGMVLIEGYLYGSGDNNRQWRCVDWKTGEEKYVATDIGKGVTIAADGMLYCYSDRGELALVKAEPAGFTVVGKSRVQLGTGQHWAHPVIHNGRLYLRHGKVLIAYRIK